MQFLRHCLENGGENETKYLKFSFFYCCSLQYYPVELENVPEYGGFKKWFQMFKLYRGKKVDDDEEDSNRLSGLFKVLVLYPHLTAISKEIFLRLLNWHCVLSVHC